MGTIGTKLSNKWSFAGGSRVVVISDVAKLNPFRKCCGVSASCKQLLLVSSILLLGSFLLPILLGVCKSSNLDCASSRSRYVARLLDC